MLSPKAPAPQAVPAAGEPTISMTALLELLKNADPEVKAQLRLALLTYVKFTTHFKAIPAHAEDSHEKADRAKTVHRPTAPNFLGYITKKNAKSYDLTFNIWCTSRDSNPGPTD